ncbi:MAG: ankyrin repeat domain-containing protein [Gemmatimonadota bacterium]
MRRSSIAAIALTLSAALAGAAPPPDSEVADAAMRGDTARVRLLLRQGADVNAAQGDGMTALHWAAARGDAPQVRMLVFAGARLEALTRNGSYTALHLAARAGRATAVRALLDAGANARAATTSGGATPLHLATGNGNVDAIGALLDKGAPVDAREGAWQQTPLMWAAAYNRVAAIETLVRRGADVRAMSKVEDVPARDRADRAANALRQRRVTALRNAERPPVAQPPAVAQGAQGAQRPGAPAAQAGAREGERGAAGEAERRDSTAAPRTAVARADSAAARRADSARTVDARRPATAGDSSRAAGDSSARPGAQREGAPQAPGARNDSAGAARGGLGYGDLVGNKGGLTALLFAVREGNTESVVALLAAGADLNQASSGDHTSPLLMATINGQFDIAKILLERGADPKLASDAGATPLYATLNSQWAAKSLYPQPTAQKQQETTYLELMEALLIKGADPNARLKKHLWYMSYNFDLLGVNTTGATPFWRAAYGTDVPAMKLLLAHGADPKIPTTKPFGRQRGDDAPAEDDEPGAQRRDPSGLPAVPDGGPGVHAIHAASGVGYGEGYAANSHMHAPDGWLPSVRFLIEELGMDVNARDHNGYNALHHAAARGDNQLIEFLVSKGGDITAVSRRGQTVTDMANGPVQRVPPFLETVALTMKLGSRNSNRCRSC